MSLRKRPQTNQGAKPRRHHVAATRTWNHPSVDAKAWGNRRNAASVKLAFICGRIGFHLEYGAREDAAVAAVGDNPMRFWAAIAALCALAGARVSVPAAAGSGNPVALRPP